MHLIVLKLKEYISLSMMRLKQHSIFCCYSCENLCGDGLPSAIVRFSVIFKSKNYQLLKKYKLITCGDRSISCGPHSYRLLTLKTVKIFSQKFPKTILFFNSLYFLNLNYFVTTKIMSETTSRLRRVA